MGMYDSLYINKSLLPLSDEQKALIPDAIAWQTKDLDCLLTSVFITDEGELTIDRTPDGWLYGAGDGLPTAGSEPTERQLDLIDHHGYVHFYSRVEKDWFEFRAKFTDGRLVDIERM